MSLSISRASDPSQLISMAWTRAGYPAAMAACVSKTLWTMEDCCPDCSLVAVPAVFGFLDLLRTPVLKLFLAFGLGALLGFTRRYLKLWHP